MFVDTILKMKIILWHKPNSIYEKTKRGEQLKCRTNLEIAEKM
jgi:hypothetical protein